jgi:hypothetical protein
MIHAYNILLLHASIDDLFLSSRELLFRQIMPHPERVGSRSDRSAYADRSRLSEVAAKVPLER